MPVAGDCLAVLPEPGTHRAEHIPREGQVRGVASLRGHPYGLPGVAAGEIVVAQAGVALAELGEGRPLPVPVASLAEQHQRLAGQRGRLGPVAVACSRAGGEQVRPGPAGQVTGPPEVVQCLAQVGAAIVMIADKRAVPADPRMDPAQRSLDERALDPRLTWSAASACMRAFPRRPGDRRRAKSAANPCPAQGPASLPSTCAGEWAREAGTATGNWSRGCLGHGPGIPSLAAESAVACWRSMISCMVVAVPAARLMAGPSPGK